MTEEQRKSNQKFMLLYVSVISGIVFAYFFGHIASVMDTQRLGLIDAANATKENLMHFKFLYEINRSALNGMLLGLAFIPLLYFFLKNDTDRNDSYKIDEVAGSARFMTEAELKKYNSDYIQPEPKDINAESPNMIMSHRFRRPINSRALIGNNNVLIVGGAGTGKSRFFIKPNILQMNASYVITDPSGEIIASLGNSLLKHGYKIKIFNVNDMKHSNCYNPLSYIRDEAGVNMVIDCFVNNTSNGEKEQQDFWVKAEKLLYSACIFYLIEFCTDESKRNFTSILHMINASAVDENNPNAKSPLDNLFEALPKNSQAWSYYKSFKQAAGKTLKSIIISCVVRLRPFFTPQVSNLTKTDDLDLGSLGDRKTALFIIVPQADRTYDFLPSMVYSQLFETLYNKGEEQKAQGKSEQLSIPVRCLMDEFANGGVVPQFPSKLSTMRKYNISATIVLQDISQIEAMYKDEWKNLVGNCSSIIYLGSSEPNTLKYFSEMLGKGTVTSKSRGMSKGKMGNTSKNFQQTARELKMADELSRLDEKGRKEIVFTMNFRPVLDDKYHYEDHIRYEETADADENKAFLYKKIAAFDNSRPVSINSMLKADSEAKRIISKAGVTDPMKASDMELQGNEAEALDGLLIEEKKMMKERFNRVQQFIEQMVDVMEDPVCMFKVESVPVKEIRPILRQAMFQFGIQKAIVFTKLKDKKIFGVGIDMELGNENTENSADKGTLYRAMNNKYQIHLNHEVKDTSEGKEDVITTCIHENVFDNYKRIVNSFYKPDLSEDDEWEGEYDAEGNNPASDSDRISNLSLDEIGSATDAEIEFI